MPFAAQPPPLPTRTISLFSVSLLSEVPYALTYMWHLRNKHIRTNKTKQKDNFFEKPSDTNTAEVRTRGEKHESVFVVTAEKPRLKR